MQALKTFSSFPCLQRYKNGIKHKLAVKEALSSDVFGGAIITDSNVMNFERSWE